MVRQTHNSQVERDIDENLRRVYRTIVEQEVPDRFMQLLEKLRRHGHGTGT
ncbi:NepR family anti-sigma factor [Yoonia sp.]|uniref:NepR family anti-sigma factor n=1 Tax=Yoonia sp. TaxID=2212373 RepID=UPI0025CEAB6A|nr:NepR family anti-sigma factor [Yoonia sp.]